MVEKTPDMRGRVFSLRGLVDYQEGSVVSRTLIDKEAGTVTVFSFDAGQELSEHTAPYDALVQCIEGEVEIWIAGKENLLKESDAIIMPAGKPHAVKSATRFKMLLTMVRSM